MFAKPSPSRALLRGALVPVVLACAPATAQTLPAGPSVAVTAVTQPSPTLPQYTLVDVPLLVDGVARDSGGRVKVNLQSWPQMNVSGPDVIRLVRSGQVEIGAVALGVVSGDVPLLDVVDLAGLNPTLEQAKAVSDAIRTDLNVRLEKIGVRLVGLYPFAAQVFFCRRPVSGIADLKGLKIRTNGPSVIDFVGAFGAQGVAVAFPEVYGALERGAIDCAITGTGTGNSVKWYEVAKYMYALPSTWSIGGYFANLKWWSGLSPDVRGFLDARMRLVEEAQWKLGAEATADGIACNVGDAAHCRIHKVVSDKPMTNVEPTSAEIEAVKKVFTETVLPRWVKRCGAECGEIYNRAVAPVSGAVYKPE